MTTAGKETDLSARPHHQSPGMDAAGDGDLRVVGVSRRIWVLLSVLALLAAGVAFAFFRSQGALDSSRASVKQLQSKLAAAEISLKHAEEAKREAIADKDQLVKELAAQGDKLAEFSRGEEQAKNKAAEASTGVAAAKRRIRDLRSQLDASRKEITALKAELEISRTELHQALEEISRLQSLAAPYSAPPQQ